MLHKVNWKPAKENNSQLAQTCSLFFWSRTCVRVLECVTERILGATADKVEDNGNGNAMDTSSGDGDDGEVSAGSKRGEGGDKDGTGPGGAAKSKGGGIVVSSELLQILSGPPPLSLTLMQPLTIAHIKPIRHHFLQIFSCGVKRGNQLVDLIMPTIWTTLPVKMSPVW